MNLDALVRPSFRLGGRTWPFYGLFVCSGIVAGSLFAAAVAWTSGFPLGSMAAGVGTGILAAGALAVVTEFLTGREVYTFYHYQIAVLAAAAVTVRLLGLPVLACLDLVGPTLGMVQAFGRIGCFMAGCCHGRPCRWGVRYRHEHADQGFERALVGVRLFPIQAVESLCLFALAGSSAALVLSGAPAGSALTTYLVGYGAIRFGLELARGDAARPYKLGFSEAQWTALAVVTATMAAEAAGLLPFAPWHLAALGFFGFAAAVVTLSPTRRLLHPVHVSEIAVILRDLAAWPSPPGLAPRVACTSLGIRLSAGSLYDGRAHYALSIRNEPMTETTAKRLATLILRLRHPSEPSRLLPGDHGVFHLLVETRT